MTKDKISELIRITHKQAISNELVEIVNALFDETENAKWNLMLAYTAGVVRGKQIERARKAAAK